MVLICGSELLGEEDVSSDRCSIRNLVFDTKYDNKLPLSLRFILLMQILHWRSLAEPTTTKGIIREKMGKEKGKKGIPGTAVLVLVGVTCFVIKRGI